MTYRTSLGSLIAQSLGIHHPECVDRLVLVAAIRLGDIAPETARRFEGRRADGVRNAEQIARIFYPEPRLAAHHEAIELFEIERRTPGSNRGAALLGPTPHQDLSRITARVLAGCEDRLVPCAHSLSIAEEIPGGQTSILEGEGTSMRSKPLQR